jgi:hypothetical protein
MTANTAAALDHETLQRMTLQDESRELWLCTTLTSFTNQQK